MMMMILPTDTFFASFLILWQDLLTAVVVVSLDICILFIKNLPLGHVLLFAWSQLLVCCIMLCLSERCLKILPFLWRVTTPYNTSDDRHDHWSFSQQYQQGWQSTSFILNGTYAFSFFSVDNEQNDGKPLWPNDIVISWNGQSDHLQYKKMWITITRRNNKTKNAGCFMRRRSWTHTTSSKRLITSLCKKNNKKHAVNDEGGSNSFPSLNLLSLD